MNKKPERRAPVKDMNSGRRRLLTTIVWGGSAALTLPEHWTKPVIQSVLLPAHAQTSQTSEEADSESDSESSTVSCSGSFTGTILNGTPSPCFGGASVTITLGPAPDRTLSATAGVYSGTGNYNPDGSFGPLNLAYLSPFNYAVIEGNIAADCSQITGQTLAADSTVCNDDSPNGNFTLT